jgi:hypothetical protein
LGEGPLIAGVIKALRLATRVEDGAVCTSACFLLFAAEEPRTAHPNSFIGVHKAADNDGRETYKSREATRAMVAFARQLGVPSTITDKMGRTPSDSLEWLSAQDLRSMGGYRQQQISTFQRNRPTGWRGAASIQTCVRRHALMITKPKIISSDI